LSIEFRDVHLADNLLCRRRLEGVRFSWRLFLEFVCVDLDASGLRFKLLPLIFFFDKELRAGHTDVLSDLEWMQDEEIKTLTSSSAVCTMASISANCTATSSAFELW
jgi:hypothetical protein